MPRQNRVTPFGQVVATPERGTLMGNRGLLHDRDGRVGRAWRLERWIVCLLAFKGRRRQVMAPGRYTELFFLDEATALAAGHRPCAECRRDRYNAFRTAWVARAETTDPLPTAGEMDHQLHAERLDRDGTKRLHTADLNGLPDGVFVTVTGADDQAWLVQGEDLLAWSPGGYRERRRRPSAAEVLVLTPPTTVGVIRAGYAPDLHPTATAMNRERS